MKITPAPNHIQLDIQEVRAGALDTSSRNTAIEFATILSVGKGVTEYKKGDKLFVKAWAIDIVNHENKKYYFVDLWNNGVKAIVE